MKTKQKLCRRTLTPTEWTKLLSVAESDMKGIILLAMTTNQRIKDIIALHSEDIDMRRNVIQFRIAKANLILEVLLDPRVRGWIEQQPRSIIPTNPTTPLLPQLARVGAAQAAAFVRALGKRSGVSVDALLCRCTFLCRLRKSGISLASIYEELDQGSHKRAPRTPKSLRILS